MRKIQVRTCTGKPITVLVDLDNVLLDFETQFLNKYRAVYPDQPFVPLEERTSFDPAIQYATLPNAPENIVEMVKSIYRGKHFFRDAPEIEGGIRAVSEMSHMNGVDVFIVTTPLFDVRDYKISAQQKYDWVRNHLGKKWLSRLILTNDKTLVKGDVLIDDKIDIKGIIKKPSWTQIVFTTCRNVNTNIGKRSRIDNWSDGKWRDILQDYRETCKEVEKTYQN